MEVIRGKHLVIIGDSIAGQLGEALCGLLKNHEEVTGGMQWVNHSAHSSDRQYCNITVGDTTISVHRINRLSHVNWRKKDSWNVAAALRNSTMDIFRKGDIFVCNLGLHYKGVRRGKATHSFRDDLGFLFDRMAEA
eukprot:Sspe_Gene.116123::Locus_104791_Transcript_1_1_Confidence_1.000_Length_407::g.116123::m.116123